MKKSLPTNSNERKGIPLYSGLLKYFPAALAGVARNSLKGNKQHAVGADLRHDRSKSSDEADCALRHLMDIADIEAQLERTGQTGVLCQEILDEADAAAWRVLSLSQKLHEKYGKAPIAPAAINMVPVEPPKSASVVAMPVTTKRGSLCDVSEGPCACGAWHEPSNRIIQHY